ncbi:MAG: outer membrane protein-like protein [Myxococcaceae bacterium]|nr:outer membrane protein-like protein [Myxococcaceae bacterium]
MQPKRAFATVELMSMWLLGGLVAVIEALTFTQALEQSARAPLLEAAIAVEATRRDHAERVSSMTHNPIFGVQPGGRALAHGGGGAEVYVSLSQRVNLAGLSGRRKEALARELEHDQAAVQAVRASVRRAVAEQWLARWVAQEALAVAERERDLAADLAARLGTLLGVGEATVIEQGVARTWVAEAQLSALALEDDGLTAGVRLAQMMGQPATAPLDVARELPQIALGDEARLQELPRDVRDAPAVKSASSLRAADSSRLAELAAARGATMALGVLGWREGGGDLAAVGTLEVDLPVFERGERERASAAAELERARGSERDSVLIAQAERSLWLHELEHSHRVLDVVQDQLLPAARSVADGQYKRLQAREASAQDWVLARRAVLKGELDAIRARAAHALARFLVAEATRPARQLSGP